MGNSAARIRSIAFAVIALLITALGAITVPAAAAASSAGAQNASISGTIAFPASTDRTGGYTSVTAYNATERWWSWSATVQPDGSFSIEGLPTGQYKIEIRSAGVNVADEWWNDQLDFESATVVSLSEGQSLTGIDATLAPGASISGTVALPVGLTADATSLSAVVLRAGDARSSVGSGRVAPDGTYTVDGLSAGSYRVMFSASGAIAREWWNDKSKFSAASVIELAMSEALVGVDATLVEGASISGHVQRDGGDGIASGGGSTWVYAMPVGDGSEPYGTLSSAWGAQVGADGGYSISGLPPGDYTVQTRWGCDCSGLAPHVDEYYGGTTTISEAAAVPIAQAGGSITGIDFSLTPTVGMAGTVSPAVPNADVRLFREIDGVWTDLGDGLLFRDGAAFWLPQGLRPGERYTVRTSAVGYCTQYWGGAWTLATATAIPLTAPARNALTMTLQSTAAGCGPKVGSATPTVAGTLAVGSTLTAKVGAWTTGTTLSYQWYADGAVISGATKSTWKLASAQKGKQLSVKVTGKKPGYTTVAKTSAKTLRVALAGTPTIGGTTAVGFKLAAKVGTWTTGTTYTYQWFASGKAITGATASTYTVKSTVRGKTITVRVTGAKSGYATIAKTSAPTAAIR